MLLPLLMLLMLLKLMLLTLLTLLTLSGLLAILHQPGSTGYRFQDVYVDRRFPDPSWNFTKQNRSSSLDVFLKRFQ